MGVSNMLDRRPPDSDTVRLYTHNIWETRGGGFSSTGFESRARTSSHSRKRVSRKTTIR